MQVFSDNKIHATCKPKKAGAVNSAFCNIEQPTIKPKLDTLWDLHQKKKLRISKQIDEHVIVDVIEIKKHIKNDDLGILLPIKTNMKIISSYGHSPTHSVKFVKQVQKNKTKQKSKLPLVLSAGIAATLIASSILILPNPVNYIIAIAICGPLSASILGLRKN